MINIIETTKINVSPWVLSQIDTSGVVDNIPTNLQTDIWIFLKAIAILVVGWIVATLAKNFTKKLLENTDIDNRIAGWIGGQRSTQSLDIEKWLAGIVYWVIILLTLIAFLSVLNLQAVSSPLNSLLQEIASFLPKIAGAVLLLAIAWLLATIVKMIVTRALQTFRLDETVNRQVTETSPETQLPLSQTIGNALYWFIFLLFLPAILSTLELQGTLAPVQQLLNDILKIVPKVFAAVLIGVVGWLIAQVVRRVVTNLLASTGLDQAGARLGLSATVGSKSLSWIVGTIVYVLILIPTAIASLNALEIRAISEPAINMLNQVLNLLPKLFAAAVVLIIAYIAAKYISELVTSILTGIGFNNIFQWLGISSAPRPKTMNISEQATVLQDVSINEISTSSMPRRTPSELVGIIVLVGIMLVGAITAVDILEIEALKNVVAVILIIAGQVLIGLVIFAIGLYLANSAFNLISSSGSRQSNILAQTARIAIITLVSAMALQQMGIAPNIINLAFGLLVGGIAVAIALAFGLGGRDVAGEKLREWLNYLKND